MKVWPIAFGVWVMAFQAWGAIYWARPTGTLNACTAAATPPGTDAGYFGPANMQTAFNCLGGGDTLNLRVGTYNMAKISWTVPTASSSSPTQITAYNGETAILSFSASDGFFIHDGAYVTFTGGAVVDGLQIKGNPTASSEYTGLWTITPHTKLDHVLVTGFTGQGISVGNAGGAWTLGSNAVGFWITNSRSIGNGAACQAHYGVNGEYGCHGIYLSTDQFILENTEWANTTFGSGIQIYCYTQDPCLSGTIRNNFIHNNGIGLYMSDAIDVYNNIVSQNQCPPGHLSDVPCGYGVVENIDHLSEIGIFGTTILRNNTFYNNSRRCGLINGGSISAYNNICYLNGDNTLDKTSGSNNMATSGEIAVTNPNFVNTTGNFSVATDFKLASTSSTAYNVGTNTQCPSTDYAGVTRPQPYPAGPCDLGVYEFTSGTIPIVVINVPAIVPPATTATVFATPTTVSGTSSLP